MVMRSEIPEAAVSDGRSCWNLSMKIHKMRQELRHVHFAWCFSDCLLQEMVRPSCKYAAVKVSGGTGEHGSKLHVARDYNYPAYVSNLPSMLLCFASSLAHSAHIAPHIAYSDRCKALITSHRHDPGASNEVVVAVRTFYQRCCRS